MDEFSLPYFSSSVPALLARPFQLSTLVVVICPILDPARGCGGCGFSVPDGMVTGHSSSLFEIVWSICMTLSLHAGLMKSSNRAFENLSSLIRVCHHLSKSYQFTVAEDAGKRRQPARNSKSRHSHRQRRFRIKEAQRIEYLSLIYRSSSCGVPPRCPEKSSLGNRAFLESFGKLEISLW